MANRPGTVPILPRCENSQRQAGTRPIASTANGHRGGPQAASAGLVPAPVAAPVAAVTGVVGPLEEPAPAVLPGRQLVPVAACPVAGSRRRGWPPAAGRSPRGSRLLPHTAAMRWRRAIRRRPPPWRRSAPPPGWPSSRGSAPCLLSRGYAALGRGVVGCHAGAAARRPAAQSAAADRLRTAVPAVRARQSVAVTCAARRRARRAARRRPASRPGSRARRRAGRGP